MKRFRLWLEAENIKRLGKGKCLIQPFYPSDYLQENRTGGVKSDSTKEIHELSYNRKSRESLSDDFASFVFLRGSQHDIENLVNDKMNHAFTAKLRHYRTPDGNHATVPDNVMDNFFQACVKYGGNIGIIPSGIHDIKNQDIVEIKSGPFAGYTASVVSVRHSQGQVHLKLVIQLVSGIINVEMSDVKAKNVSLVSCKTEYSIKTDFIEYMQNNLLTIMEHRVMRIKDADVVKHDVAVLTRIYQYRNYKIDDGAARKHFISLMLICAHLSGNKADEDVLKDEVLNALTEINNKSESRAATDTRAYLWIALYVVTRSPYYRDAAKQYVREHNPKSAKLRKFVSLIRTGKKI